MALQTDTRESRQSKTKVGGDDILQLIQNVQDYAIFFLDPEGHVTSWTPAAERIEGYRADEIVGKHFSTFYPPEDVANGKPERELKVAAESGRYEDEGWRVRKDGSQFWANVVITPLQDEAGLLRGFGKISRDLTERKRSEDELRQMRDELDQRVVERTAELKKTNEALEAELEARRQAEKAIQDLSTPVMPVREQLLIMTLIGVIDSSRALQLTEQLLNSVREYRARAVVVDITGVPIVDSKVANHLLQTVEATRLMGASVIVTGISPEIAQTLVRIGMDLSRLRTKADLMSGLEEAEHLLGYQVVRVKEQT